MADALKKFVATGNAIADLRAYRRAAVAVAKDFDQRRKTLVTAVRRLAITERHQLVIGGGTIKMGHMCKCCNMDWDNGQAERHFASCVLATEKL